MGPNAGQALLNQLRNAQQAPPQQQVRPEQLTGAGAALLAQLQAASRDLQPPHQQQPNMVQQPNAAGANLLAQLQARAQQQQQAGLQAGGLTNPGMNLLAQLQRVSAGLPSGGELVTLQAMPRDVNLPCLTGVVLPIAGCSHLQVCIPAPVRLWHVIAGR